MGFRFRLQLGWYGTAEVAGLPLPLPAAHHRGRLPRAGGHGRGGRAGGPREMSAVFWGGESQAGESVAVVVGCSLDRRFARMGTMTMCMSPPRSLSE